MYGLQWCVSPTQNFSMSFQQSRKTSVLIRKNYPFPGAHKYTTQRKYPAAKSRVVFPSSPLSCPVIVVSIRNRWSPKTSSVTATEAHFCLLSYNAVLSVGRLCGTHESQQVQSKSDTFSLIVGSSALTAKSLVSDQLRIGNDHGENTLWVSCPR